VAGSGRGNADTRLIAAIASGATNEAAAVQAGVSVRTVSRRLQEPAFKARVDTARAALIVRALSILTDASTGAATTLCELLDSDRPTVRLGAARTVLDLTMKLTEHIDHEARIAALEAIAERKTVA
jgi:hypothetical protein